MHLRNHALALQLCCYRAPIAALGMRGSLFIPAARRTRLTLVQFSGFTDLQVPGERTPVSLLGHFHPPLQLCAPCTSAQESPDSSQGLLIRARVAGGLLADVDALAPLVAALAVSTAAGDQVSGFLASRSHTWCMALHRFPTALGYLKEVAVWERRSVVISDSAAHWSIRS